MTMMDKTNNTKASALATLGNVFKNGFEYMAWSQTMDEAFRAGDDRVVAEARKHVIVK